MEQAIDTLATYRKLGDAEFPDRQAEAIVEAMNDTMGNLVTYKQLTVELDKRFGKAKEDHIGLKADFAELEGKFAQLKADFAELKGEFAQLKAEFAELKGEFAELKGEFAQLKAEFRKLDAKLETEIAKSQKLMMATVLGSSLTIVAIQVATLLSVLGPLLAIVE